MRRVVQRIALLVLAGVFGLLTVTAAAPTAPGLTAVAFHVKASPDPPPGDADADGVADWGDACRTIPGMGSNHGCPEAEPPDVTAAEKQRIAGGRIELRATCNQPCTVRASGRAGKLRLGRTPWTDYVPQSAPATLTLRLSSAKRAELRAVLRGRTSTSATFTVTATMEGEPQSTRLTLKLVR